MADDIKDELDEVEEEQDELEPEGCMGLSWGMLFIVAAIVIIAAVVVAGMKRTYDLQTQQIELEMMRNAAFQSTLNGVIADLHTAEKALEANDITTALKSLEDAHRGLRTARGQAPPNSVQLALTVVQSCSKTQAKLQQLMQNAAKEAKGDVDNLVQNVKLLRLAE